MDQPEPDSKPEHEPEDEPEPKRGEDSTPIVKYINQRREELESNPELQKEDTNVVRDPNHALYQATLKGKIAAYKHLQHKIANGEVSVESGL